MAGAATVPAPTTGIKRTTGTVGTALAGSLLFKARPWILGDSELATAAVVTPPLPAEPDGDSVPAEYGLFRDGPRRERREHRQPAACRSRWASACATPTTTAPSATDAADTTRPNLKPVMTVLYAPGQRHAARVPRRAVRHARLITVPCNETGGEELWGFVPYDQLHTVMLRAAYEPQGKANHVYIARARRALLRRLRAGRLQPGARRRDRRLDAGRLAPDPVLRPRHRRQVPDGPRRHRRRDRTPSYALDTTPPVPLWSRGNPDTQDGLVGVAAPNGNGDRARRPTRRWVRPGRSRRWRTWTRPTRSTRRHAVRPASTTCCSWARATARPGEGTTFYTLDALSGDVVATADVGSRAGLRRLPERARGQRRGLQPEDLQPADDRPPRRPRR